MAKPPSARARAEVEVGQLAGAPAVAPLGGQHHQVEGVHGLDLQPGGAAPARAVGGVERLDHDALVAAAQGLGEELLAPRAAASGGSATTRAAHPQRLGDQPGQLRVPLARTAGRAGRGRRRTGRRRRPGRRGRASAAASTSTREPTRPAISWKGTGRPVRVQGDHLAVQDEPLARQLPGGGGHLGQPVGDLVQGAGVDPYVRRRPGAPGRGCRRASPPPRRRRACRPPRPPTEALCASIGRTGRPTVSRNAASAGGPSASSARPPSGASPPASRPGVRRRRAPRSPAARPSDGDGVQRALPHLAGEQAEQEPLFLLRWPRPAAPRPAGAAFGLRPGARDLRRARSSAASTSRTVRVGSVGRGDRLAQHAPADAEPALREPAGQVRDDDRDVLRLGVPEQLGEQRDLPRARRGRGDLPGHVVRAGPAACSHGAPEAARSTPRTAPPAMPPTAASRSLISSSPLIVAPARYPRARRVDHLLREARRVAHRPHAGHGRQPRSRRPRDTLPNGVSLQLGAEPLAAGRPAGRPGAR